MAQKYAGKEGNVWHMESHLDFYEIAQNFPKANAIVVYPEYLDTNLMDGREIIFLDCVAENNFCPEVESVQKKLALFRTTC